MAGAVLLAVVGPPAGRLVLRQKESNPILEGRLLAEQQGCYGCHWQLGGPEIPNPGSRWGTVPRFAAGNAMMYASSSGEVEEFIRLGAPRAWIEDPTAAERLAAQPIRMPAYGTTLSDAEIERLVAFAVAVERVETPDDPEAARGRDLAREHGCFACHGVDGSGGLPNPGSLGGFIPGFLGSNFDDMVRDEAEFREWVLDGTSARLERNPVIRWFWDRQLVSMPAYRGRLEDGEIDAIWTWVQHLRTGRLH